jgi:ubiquitin-like 1-activating enzyme E1 A
VLLSLVFTFPLTSTNIAMANTSKSTGMPAPDAFQAANTIPSLDTNGMQPTNAATDATAINLPASMDPTQNTMFAMSSSSVPVSEHAAEQQQALSADDIALYDRQIRLWGIKAQEQLRAANVLLIGMKALGNEIAKNLVLAGIGSLTILDHEPVIEDDLCSQFFITEEDLGKNRAEAALPHVQKLNPRVQLYIDTAPVVSKLPEYFSSFDITIVTGQHIDIASNINASCRHFRRKFYSADIQGMYGYIFADLVSHQFVIEREKGNITTKVGRVRESNTASVLSVTEKRDNNKIIEVVLKAEEYSLFLLANSSPLPPAMAKNRRSRMKVRPLLSCWRALFDFQRVSGGVFPAHNPADLKLFTQLVNEKHLELQLPMETLRADFLRSFIQNLGSEISPVVAVLGGNLAQDVINVLGQREQPLQNLLLFDGEELQGSVYSMHPMNDESLMAATQAGTVNGAAYGNTTVNGHSNGVVQLSV